MRLGEGICVDAKEESKKKEQVIKEKEEKRRKARCEGGGWQGFCLKIWRLPKTEIASCQKRPPTQLFSQLLSHTSLLLPNKPFCIQQPT